MTDQVDDAPGVDDEASPTAWGRARDGFRRARTVGRPMGLFVGGVVAALLAVGLYGALFPGPAPLTRSDVTNTISKALASQTPGPPLSEQAYAAIQPSLVLIEAAGSVGAAGAPSASPAAGGSPTPGATATPGSTPAPATESLGSGVIVDDGGDILTSLHVVASATSITLTFSDGSRSSGQVVSREPDKDIAVLRAASPPANLTPAVLGNPRAVQVGSDAYVVGNPFGLYGSISAGVVSGLDRSFQEPDGGPLLKGLIQVDAAVNPGNSGGPLVDRDGRVIGIVTGLVNPTKQDVFIGIGLAVPIDVAGGGAGLPQY